MIGASVDDPLPAMVPETSVAPTPTSLANRQTPEERYRRLFDDATDLIFTHNFRRLTSVNHAGERITGYRMDELVGMRLRQLLTPESYNHHRRALRERLAQQDQPYVFTAELVRKDQQIVRLELSSWLLYENDRPVGVQGIGRDVTERDRMEQALRESEDRFRRLAESAPDLIYRFELAPPHFSYCSAAAFRTLGYSPEELYARPELATEVAVGPNHEQVTANLSGRRLERRSTHQLRRPDGRPGWVETRRVPVEDHKGRLVAIEGVIRDVTEQRRQEERERLLAKAGELLGTVLDDRLTLRRLAELVVPPLADWCSVEAIEPNGHTIGLGGSHVDPAKTPLIDILQTQYPPERDGILARSRVLTTGQAVLMETMSDDLLQANSLDREGLLLWQQLGCSSLMAVPLRARGHMLGLLTLCVAGSERKYWRDDLALAEELANRAALAIDNARLLREAQEAIRVRDEFLSVAAHELKTPTTSLRGFAQLLARRVQTNTPLDVTQVRRMVETIDRQSGRLTRLITQLLEVSRIQGGRLNLDRAPTDLAQLARHVVQEMETAAASHTFVLEIADPLVADLDPLRLEHVLINLLDNAVKYSARGSTVTVFAGKAEPGKAVLHITDEGPGIDPEHRERIFQRFFQTRTGHAGGIGLGLYVSRQIVELHGGTLELESPPQGGSRFVVTLPMLPEATDQ